MGPEIECPEVNAVLRWRAVDQTTVRQRQRRPDSTATGDCQRLTDSRRRQQCTRADKKKFLFIYHPPEEIMVRLPYFIHTVQYVSPA